ncbi:MAG: hypothetical protein WCX65_15415 [bacterium]
MRILANYVLKVGKENYGSEQYMVTVEAESEFNNIAGITDYLFAEARSAVERQINGTAVAGSPATVIPITKKEQQQEHKQEPEAPKSSPKAQEKPVPASNGKGTNGLPVTDKQLSMIRKLLHELFPGKADAQRWLKQHTNAEQVTDLSRKQASRLIESLMDEKRASA